MDLLKGAGDILRVVAPVLGTAVGGPLGGMVVGKLSEVLLGKPDGTQDEVAEAIQKASPDQLVQIKQIEADFKAHMKELDVDLERISASDRDSARKREMEVKDWTPRFIAMLTITSFFSYIGMVTFFPFTTPPNMEFVNLAIGWIGGVATSVVSYYFGSSSGSKGKDELLNKLGGSKP
jgi:hypothetical protein